ncbi:hypothetical protein AMECASPLE_000974 [Ameca splendens]|uniref:Uncharacterized protein n=1 Tax=Ameca splendens TaxID=208324 RepID=A0ABV0ZHK5_9TELE
MTPVDLLDGFSKPLLQPLSPACPHPTPVTSWRSFTNAAHLPACQPQRLWFAHLSLNIIYPQERGNRCDPNFRIKHHSYYSKKHCKPFIQSLCFVPSQESPGSRYDLQRS